jgi:hypothetical protein
MGDGDVAQQHDARLERQEELDVRPLVVPVLVLLVGFSLSLGRR